MKKLLSILLVLIMAISPLDPVLHQYVQAIETPSPNTSSTGTSQEQPNTSSTGTLQEQPDLNNKETDPAGGIPLLAPAKTIRVTINYFAEDDKRMLAPPYQAEVTIGKRADETIPSPPIPNYTLKDPAQDKLLVPFSTLKEDTFFEVAYVPNQGQYSVVHLKQNEDGSYPAVTEGEIEEKEGKIGSPCEVKAKNYVGFTPILPLPTGTVPPPDPSDPSKTLTLEVKYERASYFLKLESDGGRQVPGGRLRFGAFLASFLAQEPQKEGYEFVKWVVKGDPSAPLPNTMPANDLTLQAQWTPTAQALESSYLVQYYVQKPSTDGHDPESDYAYVGAMVKKGKVGDPVDVPSFANTKDIPEGLIFPDLSKDLQKFWYRCFRENTDNTEKFTKNTKILKDGKTDVRVYFDRIAWKVVYRPEATTADGKTWEPVIQKNGQAYNKKNPYSFTVKLGQDLSEVWLDASNISGYPADYGFYTHQLIVNKQQDGKVIESLRRMPQIYTLAGPEWFLRAKPFPDASPSQDQHLELTCDSLPSRVLKNQELEINIFFDHFDESDQSKAPVYGKTREDVLTVLESANLLGYGSFAKAGRHPDETKLKAFGSRGKAWEIKSKKDATGKEIRYCDVYLSLNQYPLSFHTDPYDYSQTSKTIQVWYGFPLEKLREVKEEPSKPKSIQDREKAEGRTYSFQGWYLDLACTENNRILGSQKTMMDSGTSHLFAKWEPEVKQVALRFESNEGYNKPLDQRVDWGEPGLEPQEAPKRFGYRFLGWQERDKDTGKAKGYLFDFKQPLYADTTLEAQWEEIKSCTLTIRYINRDPDHDGEEVFPAETITNIPVNTPYTAKAKAKVKEEEDQEPVLLPDKIYKTLIVPAEGKAEIVFEYRSVPEVEYKVRYVSYEYDPKTGLIKEKVHGEETKKTNMSIVHETYRQISGYIPEEYQLDCVLSQDTVLDNIFTFHYHKKDLSRYIVEYYYEASEGQYEMLPGERQELTGNKEEQITLNPPTEKDFLGRYYVLNKEKSLLEGKLGAPNENPIVLRVYYDLRKGKYQVVYHYSDKQDSSAGPIKPATIGKTVGVNPPEYQANGDKLYKLEIGKSTLTGVIPTPDPDHPDKVGLTLHVYYKKIPSYHIEYYYEDENEGKPVDRIEGPDAQVGKRVEVPDKDAPASKTHGDKTYQLDKKNSILSGEVLSDGSLVLKVKYVLQKATYKVMYYYDGQLDDSETQISAFTPVGTEVEVEVKDAPKIKTHNGKSYELDTKQSKLAGTVTADGNLVLEVKYARATATYQIKYYYDGELVRTEDGQEAPVGDIVEVKGLEQTTSYQGKTYILDEEHSNLKGKVQANGSLVLEVRYRLDKSPEPSYASYTIEYYFDGKREKTEQGQAMLVGETVTLTPQNELSYDGKDYELDRSASTLTGTVKEDGSLVLKIYYTKKEENPPEPSHPSKPQSAKYRIHYRFFDGEKLVDEESTGDIPTNQKTVTIKVEKQRIRNGKLYILDEKASILTSRLVDGTLPDLVVIYRAQKASMPPMPESVPMYPEGYIPGPCPFSGVPGMPGNSGGTAIPGGTKGQVPSPPGAPQQGGTNTPGHNQGAMANQAATPNQQVVTGNKVDPNLPQTGDLSGDHFWSTFLLLCVSMGLWAWTKQKKH